MLSGEVDLASVDAIRANLEPLIEEAPNRVVFDLAELRFMDSSGVALLLSVARRIGVEVRNASPIVRRMLELSGLSQILGVTRASSDRTFQCSPQSVAMARRFVTESLADVPAATGDVVALMVSELATNCVLHAGTEFNVTIERLEGSIRVSVTDTGGGNPVVRQPTTNEPHGRGLRVVEELSDHWGVIDESPGKTVWFSYSSPREDAVPEH